MPGLRATQAAVPGAVPALRQLARTWIGGSAVHPDTADDVVLAVDEAVTNVVEHAYPDGSGEVRLHLIGRECGELTVIVEDDGTWRPSPADPGFRGRGLQLIDSLADRASVTHTPSGTTVLMGWEAGAIRAAEGSELPATATARPSDRAACGAGPGRLTVSATPGGGRCRSTDRGVGPAPPRLTPSGTSSASGDHRKQ